MRCSISDNFQITIEVSATDSAGATSIYTPTVHMCACVNGVCIEDNSLEADEEDTSMNFKLQHCLCEKGYTGRRCEHDLDACADNPCYPGVKCTDLPAPANITGFSCGSCPEGLKGSGETCEGV